MKKQYTTQSGRWLATAAVIVFFTCITVSAAEGEENKWFPVSVSSVESNDKIVVDFQFKYDENGELIQSPVKYSNLMDLMVNVCEYEKYLHAAQNDADSIEAFLWRMCGSDLITYQYSRDETGKILERAFPVTTEELVSYEDYLAKNGNGNTDGTDKEILFINKIMSDNIYGELEYSWNHIIGVTFKKFFDEEMWNRYVELQAAKAETMNEAGKNELYENVQSEFIDNRNEANGYENQYTYYYGYYGDIDIWHGEEEWACTLECDQYEMPVSYFIPEGYELLSDLSDSREEDYYNAYDEYGNLIYRVRYAQEDITGEAAMLNEGVKVKQIDMYTYAYGDPAVYSSNSESLKKSSCKYSIAEIVNAVDGDADFADDCITESDYLKMQN